MFFLQFFLGPTTSGGSVAASTEVVFTTISLTECYSSPLNRILLTYPINKGSYSTHLDIQLQCEEWLYIICRLITCSLDS